MSASRFRIQKARVRHSLNMLANEGPETFLAPLIPESRLHLVGAVSLVRSVKSTSGTPWTPQAGRSGSPPEACQLGSFLRGPCRSFSNFGTVLLPAATGPAAATYFEPGDAHFESRLAGDLTLQLFK